VPSSKRHGSTIVLTAQRPPTTPIVPKPDADIVLAALHLANVAPADGVFLGDTPFG
jgi:beta-phosphoglucomutase-like phosphatase (HAD superfamily)